MLRVRRALKLASQPVVETDLNTLAEAANEAAKREAAQWFFLVSIMMTIAALVGSTTHRVLFLENDVRVPFLGVELPLVGFYIVVPAVFVVLHFYSLAQLQLMASKLRAFVEELDLQVGEDAAARSRALQRLDSFFVVQLLISERYRTRLAQVRLMAWTTLIVAPIFLLLFIQLRFLPYQSEFITWWHRALVLIDLGLVWWLWPSFIDAGTRRFWQRPGMRWCTSIVVLFSLAIATVPGEWTDIGGPLGSVRRVLFDGAVDPVSQQPKTLFSRRLILADEDFVSENDTELVGLIRTRVLRGRHLAFVVLDRTDLRKADLTGAILYGASFVGARLEAALLDHALIQSADFTDAQLEGVSMRKADLSYSLLLRTRLDGANLNGATLDGAVLDRASLVGSRLAGASLLGTSFVNADLRGSNFAHANLQAAALPGSDIRLASFVGARFFLAFAGGQHNRITTDGTEDFRDASFDGPLDLSWEAFDAGYLDRRRFFEDLGINRRRYFSPTAWHRNQIRYFRENSVNAPAYWPDASRASWPEHAFAPSFEAPSVSERLADLACRIERNAYVVRSLAAQLQGRAHPPRGQGSGGGDGDGGGDGGGGLAGPTYEPPSYRERNLRQAEVKHLATLLSDLESCPPAANFIRDLRTMFRRIEDQ